MEKILKKSLNFVSPEKSGNHAPEPVLALWIHLIYKSSIKPAVHPEKTVLVFRTWTESGQTWSMRRIKP